MNNKIEIIFDKKDFDDFREWLHFDMEALTWQGHFANEFEEFWSLFFAEGVSLKQLKERFQFAYTNAKIGPLISWFNWLKEKLLIYTFIYKRISLYDLSEEFDTNVSKLASIMHGFFKEKSPYMEEYFCSVFQIGNVTSKNLFVTYEMMSKEAGLEVDFNGISENEVMPSIEVTLFKEWFVFLKKIRREFAEKGKDFKETKSNDSLIKHLKFLQEVVALVFVGIVFIYGIYEGNKWYENHLIDKIKIYEPQFLWASKSLKFKTTTPEKIPEEIKKIDLDNVTLGSSIGAQEGSRNFENAGGFDTETEVVLTSWDSLPKDFDTVGLEQSEYEELRKGGYRDTRYGNKKVYRLMMTSVDALRTRDQINRILKKYNVVQVDNVVPGKEVPGGVYYNLFVPRKALKEFLAQAMDIEDGVLYESRTRGKNLPGMNKVFIWIKTL